MQRQPVSRQITLLALLLAEYGVHDRLALPAGTSGTSPCRRTRGTRRAPARRSRLERRRGPVLVADLVLRLGAGQRRRARACSADRDSPTDSQRPSASRKVRSVASVQGQRPDAVLPVQPRMVGRVDVQQIVDDGRPCSTSAIMVTSSAVRVAEVTGTPSTWMTSSRGNAPPCCTTPCLASTRPAVEPGEVDLVERQVPDRHAMS